MYAIFEEDRCTRRRIQVDVVVIDIDVFGDSVRARRDADSFTCSICALTMAKACRPSKDSTGQKPLASKPCVRVQSSVPDAAAIAALKAGALSFAPEGSAEYGDAFTSMPLQPP